MKIHCPNCKYSGEAKIKIPGNGFIELALWFFLIPGILYSIWRRSAKYPICPKCDYRYVVKKDKEKSEKLKNDRKNSLKKFFLSCLYLYICFLIFVFAIFFPLWGIPLFLLNIWSFPNLSFKKTKNRLFAWKKCWLRTVLSILGIICIGVLAIKFEISKEEQTKLNHSISNQKRLERTQTNYLKSLYTVIQKDTRTAPQKVSIDIRLKQKITKDVIEEIAKMIRKDYQQVDRLFILYYLDGMIVDSGAWAKSHFTPSLEVQILGKTKEEQIKIDKEKIGLKKRNYSFLKTWNAGDMDGNGRKLISTGFEVLIDKNLSEDEIINIVKELALTDRTVKINIFSSKQAFDDISGTTFKNTEEVKNNYILSFSKSPDGNKKGQITWMQEEGQFSNKYGNKDPL